jgi:hypothetical protein
MARALVCRHIPSHRKRLPDNFALSIIFYQMIKFCHLAAIARLVTLLVTLVVVMVAALLELGAVMWQSLG